MKKKSKSKKHILKPLSLWPLKPEESLEALMKVDPAKVNRKMQRLLNKRVRRHALSRA